MKGEVALLSAAGTGWLNANGDAARLSVGWLFGCCCPKVKEAAVLFMTGALFPVLFENDAPKPKGEGLDGTAAFAALFCDKD